MKIGIFDSGIGGLLMTASIRKLLPQYDYVYLGDTKRMPYGNRSYKSIFEFTLECVNYLLEKKNCGLVILACNTASSCALSKLQKEYLLKLNKRNKKEKKILGVLIPVAEECKNFSRIGVIGTRGTISFNSFQEEIKKINPKAKVFSKSAPMLASLAEEEEKDLARVFIKKYTKHLLNKNLDALILGCTHYPIFKKEFKKFFKKNTKIFSPDEIVPKKLQEYLKKHPEIDKNLDKNGSIEILVTDLTPNITKLTKKWLKQQIKPKLISSLGAIKI